MLIKKLVDFKNFLFYREGESASRKIIKSGVGSIVVKVLSTGISFLSVVVLARSLGAENYGVYAFVFSTMSLIAVPAQLGIPQLVIRESAKSYYSKQWNILKGIWAWSIISVVLLSLLLMCFVYLFLYFWGDNIGGEYLETLYVSILLVPIVALTNLRSAILQGLNKTVIAQFPESLIKPGCLMVLVFSYWILFKNITSYEAMVLHVIAASCGLLCVTLLLKKHKPEHVNRNTPKEFKQKEWIKSIVPLAIMTGAQLINNQIDIVVLTIFTDAEEVGIYKVVTSLCTLVIFGFMAIQVVMAPQIARIYESGDLLNLQRLVTLGARATLGLALPVVIVLFFFGKWILSNIFGEEYVAGYYTLVVLSMGRLVNAAFGLSIILLNMTGNEKSTSKIITYSAGANLILTLVLVPVFGALGAATASVLTLCSWNILLWLLVKKKIKINSLAF